MSSMITSIDVSALVEAINAPVVEVVDNIIKQLAEPRSRIDAAIASLEDFKKNLGGGSEQPQKKIQRRRKSPGLKKAGKVKYMAGQIDITAVLEGADEPMTTFKIVEALAEANVKVTAPALLKILELGERNKKFYQPKDGKWTLAQDE